MKKLIYCALALAAGLFAASCQQENLEPVQGGNTVTFTVEIPEMATKATIGDNASLINDLVYAVYRTTAPDLKTTLTDWDEYTNLVYQNNPTTQVFSDNYSTTVSLELINNQNYVILFWAQKNDVWVAGENFDLTKITYPADEEGNVNMVVNRGVADKYAAFSAVRFLGANEFAGQKTVELKRPFAQINIAAKDPVNYDVVVNSSSMTVGSAGDMFNVASQAAAATKDITYTWENIPATDGFTAGGVTYEHYVAMGYVFAKDNVTVSYNIKTKDHGTVTNAATPINNVPVAKNYRTNIVGGLLTSDVDYNVTLDKEWGEPSEEVVLVNTASGLLEAVNNAEPGVETEIKLEGDINLDDLSALIGTLSTKAGAEPKPYGIEIPSGKTIVLDLNGCNISVSKAEEGRSLYALNNKGTLTIKDSKGTGSISARGIYNGYNDSNTDEKVEGAKMIIESGNFHAIDDDGGAAILNCAELVINGGSFKGVVAAVNTRLSGKAEINGGTFCATGAPAYAIQNRGEMTINCATVDDGFGAVGLYGGETTIMDGSFLPKGKIGNTCHVVYVSAGKVTINGGTFKMNYPETSVPDSGEAVASYYNGTMTINGGTFYAHFDNVSPVHLSEGSTIKGGTFYKHSGEPSQHDWIKNFVDEGYELNANGEVVAKPAVAMIGETGYWSLNAAVAAVENGQIIALVSDIEQVDGVIITDKNITIDLNDKTFTVSEGASTNNRNFKINGSSVVTIKNGTMVAAGDYSSGAYGTLRTEGTANVTLENVKLYNYRGNGLNVKALSGTTVTINNTEIYSQYGGGVEAAGGNVVLNDVTIDQKGMYTAPYNSMAISVNGGGTATVNSGVYSTECITAEEANNQGTSHGPWCAGVLNSGGTLIIKGGTFSNDNFGDNSLATAARGLLLADTGANIQIEGGTFNAVKNIIDIQNNLGDASKNPKATLMGGTFSSNPLTWDGLISVAADYKLVKAEGVFNVVVDPVAKIGETEFATLQDAFNVGGEITLLRDVVLGETVVLAEGKTAVLDLNGKTLSAVDKNTLRNDGGNLTIKNGTVTRTGDVVGYTVNNASGEITVENATVARGLYTSGTKLTATNANISHEQSSRHAIYAWNCEVTINSGTFHNDNAGNATLMASGSSVVTINGGTFSIADGRSTLGWTSCMIDQNSTAQVIVKGGLFNGGFRINSADTTLTIEGGEFNTNNGSGYTDYSGTKVVKGGKFTDDGAKDWAKKYIAEGYEMNPNGEVVAK